MPDNIQQKAWTSRETFASVLLVMFLDKFGMEGLEWDPSTRVLEIEEEFDVALPGLACDKLEVAIQILTTDAFYKQLPAFITFCNVLNGDPYDPTTFDPADAEDVAWAITEACLISPPEDDDPAPFAPEIQAYIGGVLDQEGILNAPDILRLATRKARVSPSIQDFSDDPDMFHAIYDVEAGKTDDINNTIQARAQVLALQLAALNLQNGNTQKVSEMIRNGAGKSNSGLE